MTVKTATLVGLAILCLGVIFLLVGVTTPNWGSYEDKGTGTDIHFGLWRECFNGSCGSYTDKDLNDVFRWVQATAVLAVLAGGGAMGLAIISTVLAVLGKVARAVVPAGCLFLGIASMISMCLGVIIFAEDPDIAFSDKDTDYGYSFDMTIVGSAFIMIGSIAFFSFTDSTPRQRLL